MTVGLPTGGSERRKSLMRSEARIHEGPIERQADLRELQDRPPPGKVYVICTNPRHKQRQG